MCSEKLIWLKHIHRIFCDCQQYLLSIDPYIFIQSMNKGWAYLGDIQIVAVVCNHSFFERIHHINKMTHFSQKGSQKSLIHRHHRQQKTKSFSFVSRITANDCRVQFNCRTFGWFFFFFLWNPYFKIEWQRTTKCFSIWSFCLSAWLRRPYALSLL